MDFADIDFALSFGGLIAGVIVGLTGMGGAALVTPMLVLVFGINPATAVSSDVVAAAIMKPVGSWVHIRHKTVHWGLVAWLSAGSIPGVLIGSLIFNAVLGTSDASETIKIWLGAVLLVAVAAMIAKTIISARAARKYGTQLQLGTRMPVKPIPTLILGATVGLIVGMTSVGSGSLVVTVLLLLYPLLRPSVLVGTDLTQAVPMLIAGAIAHAGLGEIDMAVVVSLLIGQIPGVLIGSRMSTRYDGHLLRYLLMVILAVTALKLLGLVSSLFAGVVAIAAVVVIGALMLREQLHKRAVVKQEQPTEVR